MVGTTRGTRTQISAHRFLDDKHSQYLSTSVRTATVFCFCLCFVVLLLLQRSGSVVGLLAESLLVPSSSAWEPGQSGCPCSLSDSAQRWANQNQIEQPAPRGSANHAPMLFRSVYYRRETPLISAWNYTKACTVTAVYDISDKFTFVLLCTYSKWNSVQKIFRL